MRVIILFCILAPILANRLPAKDKAFLKLVHDTCQANKATYEDERLLKKLLDNLEKSQVQVHMRCMAEEAGLQKPNGDLDRNVIRSRIAIVTHHPADVERNLQKCAITYETPEKSAVLLWACFIRNDIPYYHVIE